MTTLAQTCLNHTGRPAVARCPSCGQSFCRECVVEHDFRLICAACLGRIVGAATKTVRRVLPFAALTQSALALAVAGTAFYFLAQLLLRIPSDVHEGIIWTK